MPRPRVPMLGVTFGKLTVFKEVGNRCLCKCVCGTVKSVARGNLRSGVVASCGCSRTTHGLSRSREYNAWNQAIARCSPTHPRYKDYGGRGIKVCKRWANSFETFLKDMGPCPQGHQLDRFPNNDGDYKPSNCRWATPEQNVNNRRVSIKVKVGKKEFTLTQAAKRLGMDWGTAYRLHNKGKLVERLSSL